MIFFFMFCFLCFLFRMSFVTILGSLNGLPIEPFILQEKDGKYVVATLAILDENISTVGNDFKISGFTQSNIIDDPINSEVYLTKNDILGVKVLDVSGMLAVVKLDNTIEFIKNDGTILLCCTQLPKLEGDLYYYHNLESADIFGVDYLFVTNRDEYYIINTLTGVIDKIVNKPYYGVIEGCLFFQQKNKLKVYNVITKICTEHDIDYKIVKIGLNEVMIQLNDEDYICDIETYFKTINGLDLSTLKSDIYHDICIKTEIFDTICVSTHVKNNKITIYKDDLIIKSITLANNRRTSYCIYKNIIYIENGCGMYIYHPKDEYEQHKINCNYENITQMSIWNGKLVSCMSQCGGGYKLTVFDMNIVYNIE